MPKNLGVWCVYILTVYLAACTCKSYMFYHIKVSVEDIHPVVEVTPFTSGKHNLHGTPWGNEVTEVTPKHTKNHWDADTDSNTYFEKIESAYQGIILWTQIKTSDPDKILVHVIRSKHENGATSTSGCTKWVLFRETLRQAYNRVFQD